MSKIAKGGKNSKHMPKIYGMININYEPPKPASQTVNRGVANNPADYFHIEDNHNIKWDKTIKQAENIVDLFSSRGLKATLAKDMDIELYHCSTLGTQELEVGHIRSIQNNTQHEHMDCGTKPNGVLWLSQGLSTEDGVITGWQKFKSKSDNDVHNVYQVDFHDEAVIMELRNKEDIAKLFDLGGIVYKEQYKNGVVEYWDEFINDNGDWEEELVKEDITRELLENDPLYYCDIDYMKLYNLGVDAVRVQGQRFVNNPDNYFKEWDVDSVAVLRGDSIKEIEESVICKNDEKIRKTNLEKEQHYDPIYKTTINNNGVKKIYHS